MCCTSRRDAPWLVLGELRNQIHQGKNQLGCWDLCVSTPPPFPSLISPISFLLDFSLPHLRFLEEGGWERKFSIRTFSTTLHFYCAYDNGPPESSWF